MRTEHSQCSLLTYILCTQNTANVLRWLILCTQNTANLFTDILCTQNTANVLSSLTYCAHRTQPMNSLHWHTVHTEHSQRTLFTDILCTRNTANVLSSLTHPMNVFSCVTHPVYSLDTRQTSNDWLIHTEYSTSKSAFCEKLLKHDIRYILLYNKIVFTYTMYFLDLHVAHPVYSLD